MKMSHLIWLIPVLLLGVMTQVNNCESSHKKVYDLEDLRSETVIPSFAELNAQIFEPRCNGCHTLSAVASPDNNINTDFSNYRSIISTAVVPSDPESSPLFTFLFNGIMPGGEDPEPLTDEEMALIYSWIRAGAPKDGGSGVEPTEATGEELYASYCADCHNALASTDRSSPSAAAIRNAILLNTGNMGGLSFLTDSELDRIANALAQ